MAYIMTITRLRREYEEAWSTWKHRPTVSNAVVRDDARKRYCDARMVLADTLDNPEAAEAELELNPEGWSQG